MDLGGTWLAHQADDALRRSFPDPGSDDRAWAPVPVPGHWRNSDAFASSDGPVLYRRRFEGPPSPERADEPPEDRRRAWLTFDGLFYEGDVWLDGSYLGDTEGYFAPQTFEVTGAMAERSEHLLAVELACDPQPDRTAKRNLTGIFQHWDCIDADWNPGGIWAPVRIWHTGPVRIASLRVTCPDASPERATLEFEAALDAAEGVHATVEVAVTPLGPGPPAEPVARLSSEQVLAGGRNRVRWRVLVERPKLWWPRALGAQPRHRVDVAVALGGQTSDTRSLATGLRQIRMRNFVATVNGERIFLKGSNLAPTNRALADASPAQVEHDVRLALDAGLDLLRVHAHIGRPELYDAADRAGLLLWQDLPLQGSYKGVRKQAVRQARQAVDLLGHHPSIAIWCGHNEPFAIDLDPGQRFDAGTAVRFAAGQFLPSWNKTRLDHSIKRTLEKADGSRPVVAHSGVLPHPAGGTDTHFYFGWYHGRDSDLPAALARFPVLARWVGEFGAQAVPVSDEFMEPARWPELDWAHLGRAHALQKEIFDQRVPVTGHPTLASWREATQAYQAELVRFHIETLRRLKYRPTGGFCHFLLADAQPAVSWSVLDHLRVPKRAYRALTDACAPVIVVADRPPARYRPGDRLGLDVHVVSDLRVPITGGTVSATLRGPDGERRWRFGGDVGADSCARVGRLEHTWPVDAGAGPIEIDLRLDVAGAPVTGPVTNSYLSTLA